MKRKLNWHFFDACDMNCRCCFCEPHGTACMNRDRLRLVLEKTRPFFDAINFAGGEPTASEDLLFLLETAKSLGFDVSIVTNGHALAKDPRYLDAVCESVGMIGVSVDSLRRDVNLRLGRAVCGEAMSGNEYEALVRGIRERGVRLKINTVVSRLNLDEDFNAFYLRVRPDRIKVFQVLVPNQDGFKHDYADLLIGEEEFNGFLARHSAFSDVISHESNREMINSYYLLDSRARFVNNAVNRKSRSILECGAEEALAEAGIDEGRYLARYAKR